MVWTGSFPFCCLKTYFFREVTKATKENGPQDPPRFSTFGPRGALLSLPQVIPTGRKVGSDWEEWLLMDAHPVVASLGGDGCLLCAYVHMFHLLSLMFAIIGPTPSKLPKICLTMFLL